MKIVEAKEKLTGTLRLFVIQSEAIETFRRTLDAGGLSPRGSTSRDFVVDADGNSRAANGLEPESVKVVGPVPPSWSEDGHHFTFDGLPFGVKSGG